MLYVTLAIKKNRLSSMTDEPLKGTELFLARKIQNRRGTQWRFSIIGSENGGGWPYEKEWEWALGAENSLWLTASKEMGTSVVQPQGIRSYHNHISLRIPGAPGVNTG